MKARAGSLAEDRTVQRSDDGRLVTGYRVLFDRTTEADAWYLARMLKRLAPERRRQLRMLAEKFIVEDALTDAAASREEGGAR